MAQLVVYLNLIHRQQPCQRVFAFKHGRQRAFAPVRHQTCRVSVRLLHGAGCIHSRLDVVVVFCACHDIACEVVDIRHRLRKGLAQLLQLCHAQRAASPPVRQKHACVGKPVVLVVGFCCLPCSAHKASRAAFGACLGDRDKARQPAARIDGHHVCRNAVFKVGHHLVNAPSRVRLNAPVVDALFPCQLIRVFVQLLHKMAQMRFTFAVQFRYARFSLFFRQAFVCADVLHLLLDALFAVFETHSVLQCAQPLDVLCVKNHVCGGFNVTVKPF